MSNNTNQVWQKLPLSNTLFADPKTTDSTTVASSAVAKALKPFEKFFTTIQSDVKSIKQQNGNLLEEIASLRQSMNKVVSKSLLDKEDWEKIRNALKRHWATDKHMHVHKISEIIAEAISLDSDAEENQPIFKLAVEKSKEYLRCTLYKTFVDNVDLAVNEYFKDNPTVEENQIDEHVKKIIRIGQWIKTNPTDEDKKLAKTLIKELILERKKNPLDEPPHKKRKLNRTYPRAAQPPSDEEEEPESDDH